MRGGQPGVSMSFSQFHSNARGVHSCDPICAMFVTRLETPTYQVGGVIQESGCRGARQEGDHKQGQVTECTADACQCQRC